MFACPGTVITDEETEHIIRTEDSLQLTENRNGGIDIHLFSVSYPLLSDTR